MSGLHLIATVGGQRIAIAADRVGSVVQAGAIVGVPRAAPHVSGIAALRSRVLTMIDTAIAVGLAAPTDADGRAIVVDIDGHGYGLLVDHVSDVRVIEGELVPLSGAPAEGWKRVALGIGDCDGEPVLVVDPAEIVAGAMPVAA